jgi:hypothetical protein
MFQTGIIEIIEIDTIQVADPYNRCIGLSTHTCVTYDPIGQRIWVQQASSSHGAGCSEDVWSYKHRQECFCVYPEKIDVENFFHDAAITALLLIVSAGYVEKNNHGTYSDTAEDAWISFCGQIEDRLC